MGATEAQKITWTHVYPDDARAVRTGVIWSEAEPVEGTSSAWWVIPDEPLPSYLYAARHARLVRQGAIFKAYLGPGWVR